jgi:Tol biopolymer transport system component
MSTSKLLFAFLLGAVFVFGTANAAFAQAYPQRVDVASDGTEANSFVEYDSHNGSMSADGRYSAFASNASNLVAGDTNDFIDVFVHDAVTGSTTRVSVASDGTQSNGASSAFLSISAEGRYVAFSSDASNLVPNDTNGGSDVFVHDMVTGSTTRVSVASDGTQGNGTLSNNIPSISADGRYVAFFSDSSNLVPNDTNAAPDVFVHDMVTGVTTRISVASDGSQGDSLSFYPSISANGRYVVFASAASNLIPNDTNGAQDIFVHDMVTGLTTRVSVASDGSQAKSSRL